MGKKWKVKGFSAMCSDTLEREWIIYLRKGDLIQLFHWPKKHTTREGALARAQLECDYLNHLLKEPAHGQPKTSPEGS